MTHIETVKALAKHLRGDGCTAVPDFEFEHCCNEHDIMYRTGKDALGNVVTRLEADLRLRRCMKVKANNWIGKYILANVGFIGVRLLGGSQWRGE